MHSFLLNYKVFVRFIFLPLLFAYKAFQGAYSYLNKHNTINSIFEDGLPNYT